MGVFAIALRYHADHIRGRGHEMAIDRGITGVRGVLGSQKRTQICGALAGATEGVSAAASRSNVRYG